VFVCVCVCVGVCLCVGVCVGWCVCVCVCVWWSRNLNNEAVVVRFGLCRQKKKNPRSGGTAPQILNFDTAGRFGEFYSQSGRSEQQSCHHQRTNTKF